MSDAVSRVRICVPRHLQTLAELHDAQVVVEVRGVVCARSVLDALEARFPVLRGTIRDHGTRRRRPMVRLFVCKADWSHEDPQRPLPDAVARGEEPVHVLGAMSGG